MDCTFVEEYSLFLSFDFIDFMYNNKCVEIIFFLWTEIIII